MIVTLASNKANGPISLLGGSGFLGSRLAAALSAQQHSLRILTRRRDKVRHLLLLPRLEVVELDPFAAGALEHALAGSAAVVNLVGVLHSPEAQPYGSAFARAHVELPRRLAAVCAAQRIPRLLHLSALGCRSQSPSGYLRSKAAGEAALAESAAHWTILQPSVVFGPGDHFTNLFARLANFAPVLPIGGASARLQPVYVDDLVRCALRALEDDSALLQRLEIAGPTVYTLGELVALCARLGGHPRPVLALPAPLAMLQAQLMALLPNPLLSPDNLRSLAQDSVAQSAPLPFGFTPSALEALAPTWLGQANRCGRHLARRARNPHEPRP